MRGTWTWHAVGVLLAVGFAHGVRCACCIRSGNCYRRALDALVGAVFAGYVAELAADAEIAIDVGDYFVIQVEIAPVHYVGDGAGAEIFDGAVIVIVHVGAEAVGHVFYDAETVVHYGGADLDDGGAEGDVFGGVDPIADAADAYDGNFYFFGHAGNQMQRNGLYGRAAIAAVRGFAGYDWARRESFPDLLPLEN